MNDASVRNGRAHRVRPRRDFGFFMFFSQDAGLDRRLAVKVHGAMLETAVSP